VLHCMRRWWSPSHPLGRLMLPWCSRRVCEEVWWCLSASCDVRIKGWCREGCSRCRHVIRYERLGGQKPPDPSSAVATTVAATSNPVTAYCYYVSWVVPQELVDAGRQVLLCCGGVRCVAS
jgi:hypothetical protein